jgi:hypothetical protein
MKAAPSLERRPLSKLITRKEHRYGSVLAASTQLFLC